MSTEIPTKMTDHVAIEIWGGDARGTCLQVTGQAGHVILTMEEAAALCDALGGFVKREAKRRQGLLRDELQRLKIAERTVFNEVSELPDDLMAGPGLAVRMVALYCPKTKRKELE